MVKSAQQSPTLESKERTLTQTKQTLTTAGAVPNQNYPEESLTIMASAVELPEDINADILKRLPVKSLVRFRCVCKSWYSLLTNPDFIRMQLHFHRFPHQSRTSIILSRYGKTLLSIGPEEPSPPVSVSISANNNTNINGFEAAVELDLDLVRYQPYYVKGHCDGLLCLVVREGPIVIWNPSIREYRTLPNPDNYRSTREVLGIGFDSSIGDYKVVRALSNYCRVKCPDYRPKVEILTLRSNTWRKLPDHDTPPYFIEHFFQAVAVNGGLYWLVEDTNDECLRCVVLRFDLAEEKFKVVPHPTDKFSRNISWLGALDGSLCLTHTQRLSFIDVWTTKDDKTWNKLITIPKTLGPESSLRYSAYAPLCFTKNGAVLILVKGEGFATYHPIENKAGKLQVRGVERWLQETVYAESLVSPYGDGGNEDAAAAAAAASRQRQTELDDTNSRTVRQLLVGFRHNIRNYFSCSSGHRRPR